MNSVTFNFSGSNVIVTGASSGIGRQITIELVTSGARVLAVARRESELLELKKEYGENLYIASVDVCDKNKMKEAIEKFVEQNGLVNGFVHAAGIYEFSPIKVFDKTQFLKMMDISFWAGFDIIQILTKKKISADKSSFVLFSSVSAVKGEKGLSAYSATKAAVSSAVRSVAKEVSGRGIRINTVMPGRVDTPMTQPYENEDVNERCLLGVGKTSDVSKPVLFLLSEGSSWITGTDLIVDGGYLTN